MAAASYAPVILATDATVSTVINNSGPVILTGTDTLTVTATGALQDSATSAVYVNSSATGAVITNSGSIVTTGSNNAIFVNAAAYGTVINNQAGGVISALDNNYSAIYFSGDLDASLTNNGSILSTGETYAAGLYVGGDLIPAR